MKKDSADIANIKDQHYFSGGELLEVGIGFDRYGLDEIPLGSQPYILTPEAAQGNFYLMAHTRARRWQVLANLSFAPQPWRGRHELKIGVDLDHIAYHPLFDRQPISFLRQGQTLPPGETCLTITPSTAPFPCSRYSVFTGHSETEEHNVEVSGYVQDRWSPTDRLLVEPGLRFDWDEIVRHSLISPRLAATYVLDNEGNTKLSAGIGILYDATGLLLVARPFAGQRQDHFFDPNGNLTAVPVTFNVDRNTLQAPRFLNWSLGVERKLPAAIYLKGEFIQKRGSQGFVYNTLTNQPLSGDFILRNTREDRYGSFQISARHTFRKTYLVMASYTRSKSRSNQVLDFNVDNPILSAQAPGPYPWDAPNRFLSWGLLPLIKGFDFAYAAEARTGFPFSVVNDQQQLVGLPGSRRFPAYFSLNTFLEKRFHLFGYHWAVRGGFENITGGRNPTVVDNNIDSPQFLTFGGFGHRAFTPVSACSDASRAGAKRGRLVHGLKTGSNARRSAILASR